jgi:hypothetical protein
VQEQYQAGFGSKASILCLSSTPGHDKESDSLCIIDAVIVVVVIVVLEVCGL